MRLAIERRAQPVVPSELFEIVTPRTNTATITPAENLLAAISRTEPFGLEIAGTRQARWFLARSATPGMQRHLADQLSVAYPQAEIRNLDLEHHPTLDPAHLGSEEQVAACTLLLRGPEYLPLRTFQDAEIDAVHAAQADPVLGILAALGELPQDWRGLAQYILQAAPDDWCKGYLRLAVEHPLAGERAAGNADTSLASVFMLGGLLAVAMLGLQAYQWYLAAEWLLLGVLACGGLLAIPGFIWLVRRLSERTIYDVRLVQEKVSRMAYVTQIRLAVFAPANVPAADVRLHLDRLAATYRQFNLASGNGLIEHAFDPRGRDLGALAPLPSLRATAVLNTRELAGLWHLPQAQADAPLIERTTARQRLPLPVTVARGCRIGVSAHQGRSVPVSLPEELLHRHLLLVAKTRRGKSSLLLTLARYLMGPQGKAGAPTLMIVDPHLDLARAALGVVPASRRADVVYLDVAERERPFGLNLLDVELFHDRDKAVSNALAIFRREFDRFWGPRMEDAFRFALLTLYEVNQAICSADPKGRGRQHTVLDVPALLVDTTFRRSVIGPVSDPVVRAWWSGYFDLLDRRLQVEIANPVQTKVQRFAGSRAARSIVGQPRSTIDPTAWLREGSIVIVNTAKGVVGEDTAGLIGGTLLNLVALAIGEQAQRDARERRSVTLLVDEFHTMPCADYEAILSELAKYGANLVLATQSLAHLDALDREQHRALRGNVFSNLDGLFAFNTSAEDAAYLVPELGEEVDGQDLVALGEHQCYARLSMAGERLPTFSIRLDPPPESDPTVANHLAAASAAIYGRNQNAVEADIRSALERIESSRKTLLDQSQAGQGGAGVLRDAKTTDDKGADQKKARNDNRNAGRKRTEPHQATLFEAVLAGQGSIGGSPLVTEAEGQESQEEDGE